MHANAIARGAVTMEAHSSTSPDIEEEEEEESDRKSGGTLCSLRGGGEIPADPGAFTQAYGHGGQDSLTEDGN